MLPSSANLQDAVSMQIRLYGLAGLNAANHNAPHDTHKINVDAIWTKAMPFQVHLDFSPSYGAVKKSHNHHFSVRIRYFHLKRFPVKLSHEATDQNV
jgi:hypothetical protein